MFKACVFLDVSGVPSVVFNSMCIFSERTRTYESSQANERYPEALWGCWSWKYIESSKSAHVKAATPVFVGINQHNR